MGYQVRKWPGIEKATPLFLNTLIRECEKRGWDYDSLLGLISHETGGTFNPRSINGTSSARGLIQMIDSSARAVGLRDADDLLNLSAYQQIPYIFAYYHNFYLNGPRANYKPSGADFLIMGLGANPWSSDSYVYGVKGSKEYDLNSSLDVNKDGRLTIGDARSHWANYQARFNKTYDVPNQVEVVTSRGSGLGFIILAAVPVAVGYYRFIKKRGKQNG